MKHRTKVVKVVEVEARQVTAETYALGVSDRGGVVNAGEIVSDPRREMASRDSDVLAALKDIADMPEYDQDDAHRLRDKARVALARAEAELPKHPDYPMTGIGAFDMERHRQKHRLGFGPERDDAYTGGELGAAGLCYATHAVAQLTGDEYYFLTLPPPRPKSFPWKKEWWKPSDDPQRNLQKAGALLAAEWDRLHRLKSSTPCPKK